LKKSNLHEENMGRLNLGIGCCHMVQHVGSSLVLSNNMKVIISRSIMFPFALYQHAIGPSYQWKNIHWVCLRIGC